LGDGRRAGFLDSVLGDLQVACPAGNAGDRRPPVLAQRGIQLAAIDRAVRRHQAGQAGDVTPTTGRISIDPSTAVGSVAAHLRASSRLAQSPSVKPPKCSLISAAGPSVSTTSPSSIRKVVDAEAGCTGAQSIRTPACAIGPVAALQRRIISALSA